MNNTDTPTSPDFSARVHILLTPASHGVRVASVYGTREQLQDISSRLQAALQAYSGEAPIGDNKPTRLFSIEATGLSRTAGPAAIEFYLASTDTPKPKPWNGPLFGSLWALVFALIGVIATTRWVFSFVH